MYSLTFKLLCPPIKMAVHLFALIQFHTLDCGHVWFRIVTVADINEIIINRIASVVDVIPNIDLGERERDKARQRERSYMERLELNHNV